ncbi:hypothetical protein [Pontixanthobacter sp.]|uniref:hypothetical protein n=1 Tax=Pontixanthobacter sp. TaxID=2792078 RepID=UPI003C7CCA44
MPQLARNLGETWEAGGPVPLDALETGEIWLARLEARGLLTSATYSGGGADARVVAIDVGMTPSAFRQLIKAEGWEIPAFITFNLPGELNLPRVSQAAEGAPKIWPASDTRSGIQNLALFRGRITLRVGCFFVEGGTLGEDASRHAILLAETGLDRDSENYLTLIDRMTGETLMRVGEEAFWAGPASTFVSEKMKADLRKECGDADIMIVGMPEARKRFKLQYPHINSNAGALAAD